MKHQDMGKEPKVLFGKEKRESSSGAFTLICRHHPILLEYTFFALIFMVFEHQL